jgi:DNA-binding NtrC family response regulator
MPPVNEMTHRAMRVLIVEDEPRLRELLAEVVPEMGFPARPARSAEEARRAMREEPADILILDLQLPGMGGMELLEEIRRDWPATQVIILTGFGDLPAAQQAIRLDVVEFLTKPCHLRDIELALEHARRRRVESPRSPSIAPADKGQTLTLAEVECEQILAALGRHNGNKTAAAAELGISRRKLHYKLVEYRAKGFVD